MTQEIARHFREASYSRYPKVGNFTITDPDGIKRSVTLWHNSTFEDGDPQPRFFEEDSAYFVRSVPATNRMTSDNYRNLLHALEIPLVATDEEYIPEVIIYATKPTRLAVQKLTVESTEGAEAHRRIRKQTLRRREVPQEVTVLGDFHKVVDRLHEAGLVYTQDFSHWTTGPQLTETPTRLNKPRR